MPKDGPLKFFMTAGQVSDYTGAAALLFLSLPGAEWLIADRGYDADWFQGSVERQRDNTTLHPRPEVSRQGRPLR